MLLKYFLVSIALAAIARDRHHEGNGRKSMGIRRHSLTEHNGDPLASLVEHTMVFIGLV